MFRLRDSYDVVFLVGPLGRTARASGISIALYYFLMKNRRGSACDSAALNRPVLGDGPRPHRFARLCLEKVESVVREPHRDIFAGGEHSLAPTVAVISVPPAVR